MRAWRRGSVIALTLAVLCTEAHAQAPVAVLTELTPGSGEVQVHRAAEPGWIPAQPLLALRSGDAVRATADARAVLLYSGGVVQTVSAANSPVRIDVSARSSAQNVKALVGGIVEFLAGQRREPRYEQLSVRGPQIGPPRIVVPRETRILPGPVAFEWSGSPSLRYRVQLVGPEGTVWEQGRIVGHRADPPARVLRPGTTYTWVLEAPGQPPQRAQFEVLPAAEGDRLQQALGGLRPESLAGYPPTTLTIMRVALLVRERLYADARNELLAGIAADAEAPVLHQLLGDVYERTGLPDLAAEQFGQAYWLARPRS